MEPIRFIKSNHPKASVPAKPKLIEAILKKGWCGQKKKYGHRLQTHICPDGKIVSYTRHGKLHTSRLTMELEKEIRAMAEKRLLVLEGEWLKGLNEVHFFDVLQVDGKVLEMVSYEERYQILQEKFQQGSRIHLLEKLGTVEECMQIMQAEDPSTEGLVFKDLKGKGWSDTGIVRCLKVGILNPK